MGGFVAEEGVLLRYEGEAESIDVPLEITAIGERAFERNTHIKRVFLPQGVRSIGYMAFSFCMGLEEINLPDSLRTINDSAFFFCVKLKSIVIPEGVRSIGSGAFQGCRALEAVSLPQSLREIGGSFRGCCSLEYTELPPRVRVLFPDSFEGCGALYMPASVFRIAGNSGIREKAVLGFVRKYFSESQPDMETKRIYKKYIKVRAGRLYERALENRDLMAYMTENKIIPPEDACSLIDRVQDCNIEIKAMLLMYQNQNMKRAEAKKAKNPFEEGTELYE